MTAEQLEEIEKLAEAATPGPWAQEVWQGNDYTGGWAAVGPHQESTDCICESEEDRTACAGEFCADDRSQNDEEQALEDAAFIRAMREYALPLVKALREARAQHERNRAEWDATVVRLTREVFSIAEERDEARTEVERLREAARQVHALASCLVVDWDPRRVNQAIHEIHALTKGMVAP